MPEIIDCIKLVTDIRTCAADPESAYLMRTRILRAVLAVGHLVARRFDVPVPTSPDEIKKIQMHDEPEGALIEVANNVLALSRHLCQPSEALDARWKAGWDKLQPALGELEAQLHALDDTGKIAS